MTTKLTHDKQKKANTTSNIIELSQAGTGTETDTAKQIRKQNRTEQKRTEQKGDTREGGEFNKTYNSVTRK